MQMARTLVATFLLSLLLAVPATAAEEETVVEEVFAAPGGEIGRYQLFDGQFAVAGIRGPELAERHLFRIDTATGNVWIGKQLQYIDKKSGRVVQQRYWEPFEQYLEGVPAPK